jgi:hypothetical protein
MAKDEYIPRRIDKILMPEFSWLVSRLENPNIDIPIKFRNHDSEIEDIFIHNLAKYLNPDVEIISQFNVDNPVKFRIDFVLKQSGKYYGIECDGKNYHNYYKDKVRDALILDNSCINTIFRFPGKAIFYCVNNCIFFLYDSFPCLFKRDLAVNLHSLTDQNFILQHNKIKHHHNEYLDYDGSYDQLSIFSFNLDIDDGYENEIQFYVHKRNKEHLNLYNFDWLEIYRFICNKDHVTDEDISGYFDDPTSFINFTRF